MVEKIVKYFLLGSLGLVAIVFIATLALDDELIQDIAGSAAEPLLEIKHDVIDTTSTKTDTFVYWVRSTINDILHFSPSDRTPKVKMRIPPPPKMMAEAMPSSPTAAAPETPSAPAPAPEPESHTMPAPDSAHDAAKEMAVPSHSAEPEVAEPMHATPSESEPAPAPEPAHATAPEDHAPPPPPAHEEAPKSALSEAATQEGAPASAPVTEVAEKPLDAAHTEQASATHSGDSAAESAPPPPPAAEEQKPGEADYQQGLAYYKGTGVERNFGKAAQFFLKAAEVGHVGAQYNLGIMNFIGQTGGQDFANAAKWFEKAANNGHAQAQYNLGLLYYEGKGVAQDARIALDWINRAATQGYSKAITARDALKQALSQNTGS